MLPFPRGGYYAVGSGGLPWTFSRTPLERILVFRVADAGELERLASGRRLTIVIEEAQRLRPRYIGPSDEL